MISYVAKAWETYGKILEIKSLKLFRIMMQIILP